MIDAGIFTTMAVIVVVVWAAERWVLRRAEPRVRALDEGATAIVVGLVAARVVAVAFDDPSAFSRLGDMLIVRSGVEFWPGVVAGVTAIVVVAHREHVNPWVRAASLVPAALLAYAAYAAACVVRDGCFGPVSSVGLVPRIGGARQFPVEWVVAVVIGALGLGLARARWAPAFVVAAGLGGLAATRLVASVWLPRLSSGWSRLEFESAAALVAAAALALWAARRSTRS